MVLLTVDNGGGGGGGGDVMIFSFALRRSVEDQLDLVWRASTSQKAK